MLYEYNCKNTLVQHICVLAVVLVQHISSLGAFRRTMPMVQEGGEVHFPFTPLPLSVSLLSMSPLLLQAPTPSPPKVLSPVCPSTVSLETPRPTRGGVPSTPATPAVSRPDDAPHWSLERY